VQQLLGNFGRFRKEKLVGEDEKEPLLDKELAWPFPTTNKWSLSIVTHHQPDKQSQVVQNLKFYLLIEYIQKLIVLKNVT